MRNTPLLPKDIYYSVNSEDDPLVLAKLLKNFKDIPADVELDIFGEIYEYFLGEFALAEGQGGGEFFTPASVVRYMVEVLAPTEGKILEKTFSTLIQPVVILGNGRKWTHFSDSFENGRIWAQ